MELTCSIFYDLLKQEMNISPPEKRHQNRIIQQVLLYTGGECCADTLYLCTEAVTKTKGLFLFLSDRQMKKWHICCEEPETFAYISRILEIFQSFTRWRERCIVLSEAEHDLQGLLEHGAAFFSLGITLYDRDYTVLGEYPPGTTSEEGGVGALIAENPSRHSLRMSTSVLQSLYDANPDFDQTFQSRGICQYPYSFGSISSSQIYYYNIFQGNFYLGRFVFALPDELTGNNGIMELIEYFLIQAERCYQYNCLHQGHPNSPKLFSDMWLLLLQNKTADMTAFDAMLELHGWKRTNRYQIIRLESHGYFQSDQTLEYYAIQAEGQFSSCLCVPMDKSLYVLRNLDLERETGFRQRLADFLRENLFKAGVSNVFSDILDTYRYRCQADDALSLGNQAAPSLWRYDFPDYSLSYMENQCVRQYPAIDLCPQNLRTLIEYDQAHPGSELVQTLYQYYTCQFNGQLAAEKLFIHRTTFFYRMNKIQKIAAFHPEDFEETTHIFLAFCLLAKSFPLLNPDRN